jgi:hypothetical protein
MSRWFRFYDDALNDPKILKLSDKLHRVWVGILCVASKNDGKLPPLDDMALMIRMKPEKLAEALKSLMIAGLIDEDEEILSPHNWNARQFKSDVSTERVKRFRKRPRNVSVTSPDTEQIQKQNTDADASGAGAPTEPIDHRKRLFNEGLARIAAMTGKGPDACRAFVGKCLKASGDDAVIVLGLIEDAERNQVVDPTAWIAARLKTRENSTNGRRTVHDAARDLHENLLERMAAFDEPAPRSLCDGTGENAVRMLPARRCE